MTETLEKEIENLIRIYNLNGSILDTFSLSQWYNISECQKLSEEFIREFKDNVNWYNISECQKLSEEFIREFKDEVDWYYISEYQKLSEEFIREFKDNVHWICVSTYQKLSEEFIREFKDNVDWYRISEYQKLSEEFIREFNLTIPETNWLYKSDKFKLAQIKKTKKYVIEDNCIIAYKGIRSDNYSKYNFQYKYEIGKTYSSHCDCNIDNENSFGLSAWTLEKAREYCNKKIIKVKIPIDKLGCIVHNGNKLRCFEFTVIEEIK